VTLYRAEGYPKFQLKLPGGYVLRMPVAGWYTWKGECIEGTGVEPDLISFHRRRYRLMVTDL